MCPLSMLKLSSILGLKRGSFFVVPFCYNSLCYAVLSVPCSLVIICWESAVLLVLLRVVFSYVFVTFSYGVPDQVWYLIV